MLITFYKECSIRSKFDGSIYLKACLRLCKLSLILTSLLSLGCISGKDSGPRYIVTLGKPNHRGFQAAQDCEHRRDYP